MAKKIIITEDQYNMALGEGITLTADVAAAGGDVQRAVRTTKQEALKNGVKLDNATIQMKASDTNEGKVIKKSQLKENRLAALKKHSEVYTVKDFIKSLKK